MGDPRDVCELTVEERHAITLLRHGPQALHALAETLGLNPEQTQNVLQRLSRKVGIVPLFRHKILRYGLAEQTRPLYEYHS
jgi:predicted ArsR family transcriptional regulator